MGEVKGQAFSLKQENEPRSGRMRLVEQNGADQLGIEQFRAGFGGSRSEDRLGFAGF